MARIYLAHVTVYDPSVPGEVVKRYCTGRGFVTGTNASYRPSGVAAHIAYTPRVKQPASMRRDVFFRGATGGGSQVGYGELVLVNADGGLDDYLDYGLDGRQIEIIVGDMSPFRVPTFTTVMKGTMEQARISRDVVSIKLRDKQAVFAAPVQTAKYGGTNSLPSGLDGVAGDIKGNPKPRCYGTVFNIQPPCVNTSKLTYQVNDGTVNDITAVYDKGAAITKGSNYATSTLLQAATVTAGTYATCFAEGYFRLGSSPAGIVTADVQQGANAAARTAAQILKVLATGPAGLSAGDVSSADVTALDTANSAECGIWIGQEADISECMDAIANSVGAWWGFDRLGALRMQQVAVPSGTAAVSLTEAEIINIDRIESQDTGNGLPAYRVKLNYKHFYTAQASDLAGGVTDARRAELARSYREVIDTDSSVQTTHLLAPEMQFNTLLINASAAQTECTRRLTLYKTRRDRFEVRAAITVSMAAALDLGAVVQVTHRRFGLSGGKLFRVLGMQHNLQNNRVDLTLWG